MVYSKWHLPQGPECHLSRHCHLHCGSVERSCYCRRRLMRAESTLHAARHETCWECVPTVHLAGHGHYVSADNASPACLLPFNHHKQHPLNALLTSMLFLLTVRPKYTLATLNAVPWWNTVSMPMGWTDGRMPDHYIMPSTILLYHS